MRRSEYAMTRAEAVAVLDQLPTVHLASTLPDGSPVLRTVHSVVDDGWLAFHSSPKGEKTGLVGRPAVIMAEESVATVPSYFSDPVRACPATTFYRSVQVHGVIEAIAEGPHKARVLQRLMTKLQPEGGHAPIDHDDPRYRASVRGLLVAGVRLERITGKAKLGQNRSPAQLGELLGALWRRGGDGDPRAVELIRAANPAAPAPAFLTPPPAAAGATLHAWLEPGAAEQAADLLVDSYWNDVYRRADLVRAHRGTAAWVGARDRDHRLIASARALSDGGKLAWVYDVVVAPAWRGRGLGRAVVGLLLDHPRVRGARRVLLQTRDAQPLYAGLGFVDRRALPPRPYAITDMILVRAPDERPA